MHDMHKDALTRRRSQPASLALSPPLPEAFSTQQVPGVVGGYWLVIGCREWAILSNRKKKMLRLGPPEKEQIDARFRLGR